MVETDESPRAACLREIIEELGVPLPIGRLLAVDWVPPDQPWDAGLMFVFDGGVLSVDPARIHLAAGELERFAFVPVNDLGTYLVPRMTRRVQSCVEVHAHGGVYLEDGCTVPGGTSRTGERDGHRSSAERASRPARPRQWLPNLPTATANYTVAPTVDLRQVKTEKDNDEGREAFSPGVAG